MFLVHQVLEFLDMPNEDLTLACTTVQVPLIPWLLEKKINPNVKILSCFLSGPTGLSSINVKET